MYRPKEWDNPNRNRSASLAGAFEAGADAMLEGLKKEGKYADNLGKYSKDYPYPMILARALEAGESGYLVFIPEEV